MQPVFSIIIPTYNRCELLPKAIDSVVNQHYSDWELVIVDDGSTDQTAEVVAGFDDGRIRYVNQTNQQLSAARNRGMQEATGRYFCFLDDDDVFLPNHLGVLANAMEATNYRYQVYRSGILHRREGMDIPQRQFTNGEDSLVELWRAPVGQFGMVFSYEAVSAIYFDRKQLLLEDFTWLNKVLRDHQLYQVDTHTAVMLFHRAQRSYSYLTKALLQSNLTYLSQAYNLPGNVERVPESYYRDQVVHQHTHYCRQLIRAGQRIEAVSVLGKAMLYASWRNRRDIVVTFAKLLLPKQLT